MDAARSLPSPLLDTARRVDWLAASVDAVSPGAMNRFSACLAALDQVARALDAPLAVVGGLAAIHHRASVTTLDVDVAVARADSERFLEAASRSGFRVQSRSETGWHRLRFEH